jgi:glycine betaine/proline transport system ATP-binding protein
MKDGAFDQIGTPAELITNPATDYVREFTTDIPKAKVLTAGDVMHPADGQAPRGAVESTATIESMLPGLLTDPRPLEVVDASGLSLGVVDREAVSRVLD